MGHIIEKFRDLLNYSLGFEVDITTRRYRYHHQECKNEEGDMCAVDLRW